MRRVLLFSAALLAGYTIAARAQNPAPAQGGSIKLSDVAGTWEGKSMYGPKDSVVVPWVLTATADGKGWTLKLANRDPIPTRIVATGGDSIVTEAGPFASVLRAGQMVTTRTTGHYSGNKMTGTIEARYASGDVIRGKVEATRK